jgi:hypothetical protein
MVMEQFLSHNRDCLGACVPRGEQWQIRWQQYPSAAVRGPALSHALDCLCSTPERDVAQLLFWPNKVSDMSVT